MRQNRKKNLSIDELKKRLAALEQKRRALESTGLLEEEQGGRFEMPETIDPTTQNTLSVYVQDNERKLGVFDAIAAKIDLLRQTVDHHFLYKTMIINKESGFLFAAKSGRPLSPTNLSSGEQNQLVLLYELLFKVKSNSLILIDEPEISFHVAWQLQFLKDLQQIIRLSEFDVLIATHSPQVINDRWDLTVELNGPAENDQ
jgi:predicted ATP-binding protein involved in virulence